MDYPKKVFVQVKDKNTDDPWLEAFKDAEDCENGKIAVYELKEMKMKRTETIIE